MTHPMAWRRPWGSGGYAYALTMIYPSIILLDLLDGARAHSAERTLLLWMAAFTVPGLLWAPFIVWRAFRSRNEPAVALDSSQLTVWGPLASEPMIIPLDDAVRVEWVSMGVVGLRLQSGEVRSVSLALGKRARAEFVEALRKTLAERRVA